MTCIGLITQRPTNLKKHFFGGYTKEVILNEKNPFRLVSVSIPVRACELEGMKEKRQQRLMEKARRLLTEEGTEKIIFPQELRKYVGDENKWLNDARRMVFLSVAPRCVRQMAAKCGINLLNAKICITDSKMERISETLMWELRYDTRFLVLCTSNRHRGQEVCERFFNDTGMFVSAVTDLSENDVDIVIDIDNGAIRFGRDITVDGIELDFDTGDAGVDSLELAACVKGLDISNRILSYFSGKKKLTL